MSPSPARSDASLAEARTGCARSARVFALLVFAAAAGCSEERSLPVAAGGVHPPGWATKGDPAFHADWLKANKFVLQSRCTQCHGDDFAGGAVGVSCSQANCHQKGPPTFCTTCHGSRDTPRPDTGAHWAHQAFCDTCHHVPTTAEVEKHASGDEASIIRFSGLALHNGANPTFDMGEKVCSNTYCHGAKSPGWTSGTNIQCDGCHKAPPENHARWARLAPNTDACATCHPAKGDPTHVNGTVDLRISSCTTCHGSNGHPNPPVALDGSTDPTSRGVGAHERHLDATLPDRMGRPLACSTCHVVPTNVLDPGHIDQPQTRVRFVFGGAYDATNATCNVWCHFNKTPGPTWTDASGNARKCDACHAFPPVTTRAGTPHPSVAGDVAVCRECHVFETPTHVNGVVDFRMQ